MEDLLHFPIQNFLGLQESILRDFLSYRQTFFYIAKISWILGLFEGKKALAKIKPTIISSLCKLFIMPAIFLPIAAQMGFRDEKMVAILIMLGAPTTVSCYIMSKNMGHEGVLSSSCVVSTTFLSSVFITLWLFLLRIKGLI